jgi:hypothetical protein
VFDREAPRRHLIWGWMQVDSVVPVDDCGPGIRAWAGEHPHFHHVGPTNTLYFARRELVRPDRQPTGLPGSGTFPRERRLLKLTDPFGFRPSQWRLPVWMQPQEAARAMSYHRRPERWSSTGGLLRLEAAARGQEFVFSTADHPRALPWLTALIGRHGVASDHHPAR